MKFKQKPNEAAQAQKTERALEKIQADKSAPPVPFEPRCSVCTSPHRQYIDLALARYGASYADIARRFPGKDNKVLDRRAVSRHAKEHLGHLEDSIRRLLEAEAESLGQDYEENVKGAITSRGILENIKRKAFDDIMSGRVDVETKDLIATIQMIEKMDEQTSSVQVDYLRAQASALIQAIKEIVEPDQWELIAARMRRLLDLEGYAEEPIMEAEVVDAKPEQLPSPN